jgi:TRAP-type C4-dicarboxylate transport system permease small subunit
MTVTEPSRARRRYGPELLIEVPAVIVIFVMMGHIVANAVLRTWWDNPIDHTLEIVEYWYLPLVAFLGFIAAQHRGQHIAADLIYEKLPTRVRGAVLFVMLLVCSIVSFGFAWFGWSEARHAHEIRLTAGVSTVPAWPTYYLVPLAFGSLTLQFLYGAVEALVRPEHGHVVTDPDDALVLEQMSQSGVEKE